jgi:hypothetical protein
VPPGGSILLKRAHTQIEVVLGELMTKAKASQCARCCAAAIELSDALGAAMSDNGADDLDLSAHA